MVMQSHRIKLALLVAPVFVSGCVVLPMHVYVAEPGAGTPVYERCSLTPTIPTEVKVEQPRLEAFVSVVSEQGHLVRVRFDIPEGTTAILRESTIRIDARDGTVPRLAPVASVNPVAPARYPETEAIQRLVLPVDTPMRGGRLSLGTASSNKHYWIAAPFTDPPPGDVWITLPELSVEGSPARFDEIHFIRRSALGLGPFNC
jgi:hypothetical protein